MFEYIDGLSELILLTSRVMGTLCHLAASLGATAAGLSALTAVVSMVGVFFTFVRAGFADVGAKLTDIGCVWATAGHERNGRVTNLGAITVEPNTIHHHQYVLFRETGFGAGIAANGAVLTGINTILVLLGGYRSRHSRYCFGLQSI